MENSSRVETLFLSHPSAIYYKHQDQNIAYFFMHASFYKENIIRNIVILDSVIFIFPMYNSCCVTLYMIKCTRLSTWRCFIGWRSYITRQNNAWQHIFHEEYIVNRYIENTWLQRCLIIWFFIWHTHLSLSFSGDHPATVL